MSLESGRCSSSREEERGVIVYIFFLCSHHHHYHKSSYTATTTTTDGAHTHTLQYYFLSGGLLCIERAQEPGKHHPETHR